MTDEELLYRLIEMFDSREEAEHVAECDMCDASDSYRCPQNPVSLKEAAELLQIKERAKVVWFLQGCPPMDDWQWSMHQMAQQMEAATYQWVSESLAHR